MASLLLSRLGLVKMKVFEGSFEKLGPGANFYQLTARTLEGEPLDFKTLAVEMHKKYGGNLQIMAFPSNEFGKQEPYPPAQIREFVNKCEVRFHMMEKTTVNGPTAHPVWQALKRATGTEDRDVSWNFETKFLVGKDGVIVERFSPAFDPKELTPFVDRLLGT